MYFSKWLDVLKSLKSLLNKWTEYVRKTEQFNYIYLV